MNKTQKKLFFLLKSYIENKVSLEKFDDIFYILFNQNTDFDKLFDIEYNIYSQFNQIISRYSPYEDDIKKYPNVYFASSEVRKAAEEACVKLQDIYK